MQGGMVNQLGSINLIQNQQTQSINHPNQGFYTQYTNLSQMQPNIQPQIAQMAPNG